MTTKPTKEQKQEQAGADAVIEHHMGRPHLISKCLLRASSHSTCNLASFAKACGRSQSRLSAWASATYLRDLDRVLDSWLWPDLLSLSFAVIWGNEPEDGSCSLSLSGSFDLAHSICQVDESNIQKQWVFGLATKTHMRRPVLSEQ